MSLSLSLSRALSPSLPLYVSLCMSLVLLCIVCEWVKHCSVLLTHISPFHHPPHPTPPTPLHRLPLFHLLQSQMRRESAGDGIAL